MTDISRVAVLINKLLALANDKGATEAEASLAAEKAQALMMEHNLSMASVEAAGGSSGESGQRIKDGMEHRQVYKWQRNLMKALAELNFCFCKEEFEYHRHTNSFKGYQLIGRAANVASTRIMFDYLLQAINRLAKDEVGPKEYFTRYGHSFKEGCADRIVERLQERRATEVAEQERKRKEEAVRAAHPSAAKSSALVVVLGDYVQDEVDLNEDFRRGREPGTTKALRLKDEADAIARREKRQQQYDQRRAAVLAERPGIDGGLLDWLARGWSEEEWIRANKPARPETENQRRKREERERRENARYWDKVRRENSRLDMTGYHKGVGAGDKVGLDQQVDAGKTRKLG